MTAGASILLLICVGSLTAGCASAGRLSPNLFQSRTSEQRAELIPGSCL